jgi:Fe-Mn family superoxide dismutase
MEVTKLAEHYPFVNTPLPYGYDALEPYIDKKTMHLHYDRHLQAYVDNLNAAMKDRRALQEMSLEQLICIAGRLPENIGIP